MNMPALIKFDEALRAASQNELVAAVAAFREVAERWPTDDLADDALYNLGACYLAMSQFIHAQAIFEDVIKTYPNATLDAANGRTETGRTAAKAWLGLVSAHLGQGNLAAAEAAGAKLVDYPDSKITPPSGPERSFHDIAGALLSAARHESEPEAETVSPADIIADAT